MDYLIFLIPFAIMALYLLVLVKPARCPNCRKFTLKLTGRERRLGVYKRSSEYQCNQCNFYIWRDIWRRF